jgi:hypothetical protein
MPSCETAVIAANTNVIVRFLTGDDPRQLERAKALFASETMFIPKTVMHLASAKDADIFTAFDEDFVKRGSRLGVFAL